ncbi:MAG: glycosyltransferase [Sedimentisphaerales bacterium]|nr:glycosyltransferase [Sedimentisphaerales bacterium]
MCNQTVIESNLSVLMSTCIKDRPKYLDMAIESIISQTRSPDEIVVVKDGPLTDELSRIIKQWQQKRPGLFKLVSLPENCGLGVALQEGLKACSYDIVARMDADDISCPERFEKQLKFLQENPDVAIVSSWMAYFEDNPSQIVFIRQMPQKPEDISKIARFRNPICHPPAMFRRSEVEAVGGYTHRRRNQDYHLWVRMLLNGSKITCIPQPLYKFRCNSNLFKRRTSFQHLISMIKLQKEFLKMGFISYSQYLLNISVRIIACILPVTVTQFIRTRLLKL